MLLDSGLLFFWKLSHQLSFLKNVVHGNWLMSISMTEWLVSHSLWPSMRHLMGEPWNVNATNIRSAAFILEYCQ